jgi:hypothetical protein
MIHNGRLYLPFATSDMIARIADISLDSLLNRLMSQSAIILLRQRRPSASALQTLSYSSRSVCCLPAFGNALCRRVLGVCGVGGALVNGSAAPSNASPTPALCRRDLIFAT